MLTESTRFMIVGAVLATGVIGWNVYSRKHREKELLKSQEYKDAVSEWEKIQAWFVRDYKRKFTPFSILLDTGGFCAFEITVTKDNNGNIKIPIQDLSTEEFMEAVHLIKEHFKEDYRG